MRWVIKINMGRKMRKQVTLLLGIIITIFSISLVYAAQPNWFYGDVTVNTLPVDGLLIVAYNETGNMNGFDNPSFSTSPPFGKYSIDVFCTKGAQISFKSGTLIFNQQNQVCVEGGSTTLDLTATDSDNDGYSTVNDCNDNDPSIHPGALEICDNGVDDNCDGLVDLNDSNCQGCIDRDNDGYGVFGLNDCPHSELDCNDNNTAIHPGATELCNGIDDNCDGLVDKNPNNSTLTRSCYTASYGEGVGICQSGTQTCTSGTYTGAPCVGEVTPQSPACGGQDNDCDGFIDEGHNIACGGGGGAGGGGGGGGGASSSSTTSCTETWTCTDWSTCASSGTQTRTCTDSNTCGTTTNKPAETQTCTYVPPVAPASSVQGPVCGDGTCDANEDCSSCSSDCGACGQPAMATTGGGETATTTGTPTGFALGIINRDNAIFALIVLVAISLGVVLRNKRKKGYSFTPKKRR